MNGLMPGRQIDDAQPPHSKSDAFRAVVARVVRTAMYHRIAHRLYFLFEYRLFTETQQTGDSTHTGSSSLPLSLHHSTIPMPKPGGYKSPCRPCRKSAKVPGMEVRAWR